LPLHAGAIDKYQKKISGPILDRIDLHLPVQDVDHKRILEKRREQRESEQIKKRVEKAYTIQKQRFGKARFNSSMSNKEIRDIAKLSIEAKELLDTATARLGISARAYIRTSQSCQDNCRLKFRNRNHAQPHKRSPSIPPASLYLE
jgi:predicted ATPase with chaperone activity